MVLQGLPLEPAWSLQLSLLSAVQLLPDILTFDLLAGASSRVEVLAARPVVRELRA